ncbi:hypothetical protein [Chryseobacterium lineare]
MNIESFRAELKIRLFIEKEYILQEISSTDKYDERLELLGKFNEKYKEVIKRIANEEGINLTDSYPTENPSNSGSLTYGQMILGKTMSIYDQLVDELYEKITHH